MTSAFELYYKIQKRIHNTRTLHLLNLLAMAGQVGFVFGGFMAYSFHSIAVVIILLVLGKKRSIFLTLLLVFLPTALLTESGMNAVLFVAIAYTIRKIEQGHRQMIVSAVSGFSEKYSPLYEKRLANKQKYKEYFQAYMLLEFFDAEDFILIDEKDEKYTYKKLGIYERRG